MRLSLRSTALRTALGLAAAVLLLSLLGAGWGWLRADRALRQQLDLILVAETEGLLRDYERLGPGVLLLTAEAAARRDGPLLILLQGGDGRVLAGRVPGVPPGLRGFATIEDGRPGGAPLRALGAVLPGGLNLVVAARLAAVQEAAQALAWTPVAAALGAGAAALALGVLAARALERRLASVSDAALHLAGGDLSRRLPQAGRGDEFDRLVGTVNAMLARLEALVTAQRQVTDDIAHDLRRPLQRLRLRLETAAAEGDAGMEAAVAELDEVLDTFAALLRIAQAEAGAARRETLDASALVTAVAEAYRPVAEEAGRPFRLAVTPGLRLRGDAALLQRMLGNLLDNALAHGRGAISVELGPGPVLLVSDDGPGVPEAERAAVLRRFVRLDRSRGTPGSGLGLALVAAAVGAHGGTVRLLPGRPDGGGLCVRVELGAAGF